MTLEEGVHPLEKYGWFKHKYGVFEESNQRLVNDDKVSRPKIQRLPGYMGGRAEFKTFYLPKLIEIGPILHLQTNAGLGDAQKLMWTSMFLKDTNQNALDLCKKMFDHLEELMPLFSPGCWRYRKEELTALLSPFGIATDDIDLANRDFKDIKSWILLVDGCSVLQVLDKSNHSDPEQVLRVSVDQLVRVHQDLLLLENQIPFQVLKLLSKDEAKLKKCMDNFLEIHRNTLPSRLGKQETTSTGGEVSRSRSQEHKITVQVEDDPVHLLDHLRRAILGNSGDCDQGHKDNESNKNQPKSLHLRKYRIGSIRELKAEGIRVKKHPNNTSFHPNFVAGQGQLQLPELTVDGSTGVIFLNLIAYEMCPDFRNNMEISSYVVFLSSLIEQPEDVKELRSAGVLRNELASDKEVADLFNKMDVVLVPPTQRYANIIDQIQDYIKSKHGRIKILSWMDDAYNTYFRSPWTIVALLAAALGLTLTFIQTWFAIHPKGS